MSISIRIQKDITGGYTGIARNKMGKLMVINGKSFVDVIAKYLNQC